MDLVKETILFNKNGFIFTCIKKNHYKLTFFLENSNIILSKIIGFDLIKLIYDLNPDVYEKVNIEKINDNEANLTLLIKHFFEDLGLPQRYSFIHIKKIEDEEIQKGNIIFNVCSIKGEKPEGIPEDAELMAIKNMIAVCNIITPHKIHFSFNVIFDDEMFVPPFAEKMVGMVLHKIFKRVKQFVENIRI